MGNKAKIFKASHLKRFAAFNVDIMIYSFFLMLFFEINQDTVYTSLSLLVKIYLNIPFIIPWKVPFITCVIIPLFFSLSVYIFSATPGQALCGIFIIDETSKRKNLTLSQVLIKTYLFVSSIILFLGIPYLVSYFLKDQRPFEEKIAGIITAQKQKNNENKSFYKVLFITLFLGLLPLFALYTKVILLKASFKKEGIFIKGDNSFAELESLQNLTSNFEPTEKNISIEDFFEQVRSTIINKDMKKHILFFTQGSQFILTLTLDQYESSLPEDIQFERIEDTEKENIKKLFYKNIYGGNVEEYENFILISKVKGYWKIDYMLFLKQKLEKEKGIKIPAADDTKALLEMLQNLNKK